MDSAFVIRHRPFEHYILSIFSLLLRGETEIRLKAYGKCISKAVDIINLLNEDLLPEMFLVKTDTAIEQSSGCKVSTFMAILTPRKDMKLSLESVTSEINNICHLELIINRINSKHKIDRIELKGEVSLKKFTEVVKIGDIFPERDLLQVSDLRDSLQSSDLEEKSKYKMHEEFSSKIVDSLMRCSVLTPDYSHFLKNVAQWDDIILGLDTNIFYPCTVTSSLLNNFLGIPSKDFLDTPDWITLVLSKVAMGEIENSANMGKASYKRRLALRGIQEIMKINKSKDLEGVSLFLAGTIPPEFDFTRGDTNTIRDSTIREQFRAFLKSIDFHKGTYFITHDFNNSVLAEAEGMRALYIRKPSLNEKCYNLSSDDKCNISELLYELSVAFNPLDITIYTKDKKELKFSINSNWKGKDLENWENWEIEYTSEDLHFKKEMELLLDDDISYAILNGWQKLRERYIDWNI
jgi:DNA-binding protein Alba